MAGEILVDGGLEDWASATDLTEWVEDAFGGTVNQETTIVHSGSNACRLDKTSASGVRIEQPKSSLYRLGKWYRYSLWSRGDGTSTECILRAYNVTKDEFWDRTIQAWGGPVKGSPGNVSTVYTRSQLFWFRIDPTFDFTDSIQVEVLNFADTSGSTYVDDLSVVGPYDVPTISITGTIRGATGAALVGSGIISARLNGVGQISNGTDNLTIPSVPQIFPVVNGIVRMDLIPTNNDGEMVPTVSLESSAAPRWSVSYDLPGYPKITEIWNPGLTSPIDITQVPKG